MNLHDIKKAFGRDTENHSMEVVYDDGVNRHLIFSNNGSWNQKFGIVTWSNYLCYYGDMGSYLFERTEDMFAFFRSKSGGINPCYWSEKLEAVDRTDGFQEYSYDLFKLVVMDIFNEHEFDSEEQKAKTLEEIEEDVLSAETEEEAYRACSEFRASSGFEFSDFWETDLKKYTYRYIWACHAIVWGISEYDKRKEVGE